MTVLIAEDNPAALRTWMSMLRRLGHVTLSATGVGDLARSCENFRPDLIISDVDLGDGDGIEACRVLREHYPDLPVAIMSSDSANLDRARGAGFCKILMKPFSLREIESLLQSLSSIHRSAAP